MKQELFKRAKKWLFTLAAAGILCGLWLLINILPWRAAAPSEVEAARRNLDRSDPFVARLVDAALDRTRLKVRYDGAYVPIKYPGGDVPESIGVCTDEVIRSYRVLGIDLQQVVHEDMKAHFDEYPKMWDLAAPDTNIDHRRVPNLQKFFARQGAELPVTAEATDYRPGDLITCMVRGNRPHIAIVVPSPTPGGRPWIMHNCGFGPKMEDKLFAWKLTGHYRWNPKAKGGSQTANSTSLR